jgi:hypothetical protein
LLKLQSAIAVSALALCAFIPKAYAWNEEGHRIVALVAAHYLEPAVKQKVEALLATDTDSLTKHDVAGSATWMDASLAADRTKDQAAATRIASWQNVTIELDHPDLDAACNRHPPLPAGTPASSGPAACAVDKVNQFAAELAAKSTPREERLLALKYLLSLVGDLHQPTYASDNHNDGGESTRVGGGGSEPGSLRHYWDAEFMDYLGDDPAAVADDLADGIRQSKTFAKMSAGTPADWAMESFGLACDHAYGKLPAKKPDGSYDLPPDYVTDAIETVRLQLARAGVRLAALLNKALSSP